MTAHAKMLKSILSCNVLSHPVKEGIDVLFFRAFHHLHFQGRLEP